LAGRNEHETLDHFLQRFRLTLQCVANADVYGSGHVPGRLNSLTLYPYHGNPGNVVPLRTNDGQTDLRLGVYHSYTVVQTDEQDRGPYKVSSSSYQYSLLDRNEREIVVYRWHPEGVNTFADPHMHVSGAAPIELALAPGEAEPRELAINKAHFPTARFFLEDVVALLIREFDVAPRRADWADVLNDNLAAIQRGRTW
jgi:hypothetical protein